MAKAARVDNQSERWYKEGYYSDKTLADHMQAGTESFPDVEMCFVGGPEPTTITLGEMFPRSRSVAAGLQGLGVGVGDAVAIWVPNWLEGAIAYQAALMLGATVVPIVHIYGPNEVGFILRESGAKVLIMPDRWRNINYRERFDAIVDIPELEKVILIGDPAVGPDGIIPWEQLSEGGSDSLVLPDVSPDDVCLLIFTSGTTAAPKGVQHTHNTLYAEVKTTAEALGDRSGVHLASFPAGHIAGVLGVLRMFMLGASSVVMDQWDPAFAARLVEQYGIQFTAGAPFYLSSLLEESEKQGTSLDSFTSFMVGAASVPQSLVERADAAGVVVYRAYGSSEHPVITTGSESDPLDKRAATDGQIVPGSEIKLLDDDDNEVAQGEDGEIVSLGPDRFVGYTDPELNAEAFLPGGWFRTGDIGRIDEDGYLTITDRKKDVIIRGGENIASKEVEDILARHPSVMEAAAVGVPDERYGERVAVFVQLNQGASLDLEDIRAHFVAAGVAKQKTPEFLHLIDDLPRGMSGKVRKVDLRDKLRD